MASDQFTAKMRFKPALTAVQLNEIQARNHGSEDVFALLWEIKRLRAIVLRADQLQRGISSFGGASNLILDCLREELKSEPVVLEQIKLNLNS